MADKDEIQMKKTKRRNSLLVVPAFLFVVVMSVVTVGQTIPPSPFWKSEITFPDDLWELADSWLAGH